MKYCLLYIIFFLPLLSFAQEDAWVYFKDKPDAAYYLNNPLQMLSQRSMDRRAPQNISLDEKDVPITQSYIDGVASGNGINVMAKSKWLNALHIRGSEEAIRALIAWPFVARIEFANRMLSNETGRMAQTPQFEAVNKQMETAADFNYGNAANQIEMLNGHLLHKQDFTGMGKIIAVLDAGFPGVNTAQPFQQLRENGRILGGYNLVSRIDDVYTGGTHGTLVLSTMGGYTEGQLVGTAPDASYYLFITEDVSGENPLEESLWVEAAETADSLGVDVINTSLGYFRYDNPAYSHTYEDITGDEAFISRGANIAFSRGMICVTSAGNNGNTTDFHIGVPADALTTLTIGAVTVDETYATFSSRGPTFDGRIKPDVMARGVQSALSDTSGTITTASGTSFSSPITAGLVACLWQALPESTNAEIVQLIKESADRYTAPTDQYGYGIPDFSLALERGKTIIDEPITRFKLYPNPSRGSANLIFPEGLTEARVLFFNVLGQVVLEQLVASAAPIFSTETLATGIYTYRIESKQNAQKGLLIKE